MIRYIIYISCFLVATVGCSSDDFNTDLACEFEKHYVGEWEINEIVIVLDKQTRDSVGLLSERILQYNFDSDGMGTLENGTPVFTWSFNELTTRLFIAYYPFGIEPSIRSGTTFVSNFIVGSPCSDENAFGAFALETRKVSADSTILTEVKWEAVRL